MKSSKLSYTLILIGLGLLLSAGSRWSKRRANQSKNDEQSKSPLSPDQDKPVAEKVHSEQTANIRQQTSPSREVAPVKENCEGQCRSANDNKNPSCCVSAFSRSCKKFIKRAQKPISIFTGMLVLVAVFQTCTFVASERAMIIPTDVKIHNETKLTGYIKYLPIYVELQNGGKSTATIDVMVTVIGHSISPIPPTWKDWEAIAERYKYALSPILPNGKLKQVLPYPAEWGAERMVEIRNRKMDLYFYGVIRYRDEFSQYFFWGTRETGFCFFYRPTGGVEEPIFETCREKGYTYTE